MANHDENGQGTRHLNEETEQPKNEHQGEGMLDPSMIELGPFGMEEYNLMISQRAAAGLLSTWSVDYEPVCWMIFRDVVKQRSDLGRFEAYVGVGNQGRDEFLLRQKKAVRDYCLRNGHTEPLSALYVSFLAIKTFWVKALEPKGLIRLGSVFEMIGRKPLNNDDIDAEYEKMRTDKWGTSAKAPKGTRDSTHAPADVRQASVNPMNASLDARPRLGNVRLMQDQTKRQRILLKTFPKDPERDHEETTGLDCLTVIIRAIYARLDSIDRSVDEPIDEEGSETIKEQESRLDIIRYCLEVTRPNRDWPSDEEHNIRDELIAAMGIKEATFIELMDHPDVKAVFRRCEHRLIAGTWEQPLGVYPAEPKQWGTTLDTQACHDLSFPTLDCAKQGNKTISEFVNGLFLCRKRLDRGAKIQLVPTPPAILRMRIIMADKWQHDIKSARSFELPMESFGTHASRRSPRYHLLAVVMLAKNGRGDRVRTYNENGYDIKPSTGRRYSTLDWVLGSPHEQYVLFYARDDMTRVDDFMPDFIVEPDPAVHSKAQAELGQYLKEIEGRLSGSQRSTTFQFGSMHAASGRQGFGPQPASAVSGPPINAPRAPRSAIAPRASSLFGSNLFFTGMTPTGRRESLPSQEEIRPAPIRGQTRDVGTSATTSGNMGNAKRKEGFGRDGTQDDRAQKRRA